MLWHVYLRKGTVFVPTVAKTDAGFFIDVEPVAVVESTNRQEIISAIKAAIGSGNPIVATPTRAEFPKPVVLKYANVKSWATFEKNAFCWTVKKNASAFELHSPRMNVPKPWEEGPAKIETFDTEAAIDVLSCSIADQVRGTV